MISNSESVLKRLIDNFRLILGSCLNNFYDEQTQTYIEPIVLIAMLHEIQYFFEILGTQFIKVSGYEKEAKELLSKNIDELKQNLIGKEKGNPMDNIQMTQQEVVDMFLNHPAVPECDKKLIASDPSIQERCYQFAQVAINLHKKNTTQ